MKQPAKAEIDALALLVVFENAHAEMVEEARRLRKCMSFMSPQHSALRVWWGHLPLERKTAILVAYDQRRQRAYATAFTEFKG